MDKTITNFHQHIEQQVRELLLPVFLQKVDAQYELLLSISRLQRRLDNELGKLENKEDIFEKAAEYQTYLRDLYSQISASTSTKESWERHFAVGPFVQSFRDAQNKQPGKLIRRQRIDRFTRLESDAVLVKVVKTVKNLVYRISVLPSVVANKIRALRKKERKPIQKWKHTIPWAAMVRYHYGVKLTMGLTSCIDQWANEFLSIQRQLRQWEDTKDDTINSWVQHALGEFQTSASTKGRSSQKQLNALKKQNRQLMETLQQDIERVLSETREEVAHRFPLAGTFELPHYVYTLKNPRRKELRANRAFQKSISNCYRYLFQIQQDWIFDRQISISCLHILTEFQSLGIIFTRRKEEKLEPSFAELKDQIAKLKRNIETPDQEIKMQLLTQKRLVTHQIGPKIIAPLANDLLELDSPALVHRLVSKVELAIESFDQAFWLTKDKSASENLKDADFYLFDPKEIIEHEMMPRFQQGINEIKARNFKQIDALKKGIDQIDNILLFNLEGAIEAFGQDEDSREKSRTLAIGGVERALNKLDEEHAALGKLFEATDKDLKKILVKFLVELHGLSDNESAILLRLKLTRTKTLQQTARYRNVLMRKSRGWGLRLLVYMRKYSKRSSEMLLPWRRRIGLAEKQSIISSDLSDFLSFATEAIGKLPAIYQRLYSVKPLTDKELFVGRTAELREIRKAVDTWKKGGEASILLTSEKWSGRTSIINYFVDEFKSEFRFIRCAPVLNTNDPSEFLGLWGQWLSHEPFASFDELASHLKALPGKWCVLFEDVQKLFLRRHNGMQNVRLLLDLILETQGHCFWLCSITQYARDYLDQTLQLSEHFSQRIQLGDMKNEQITEVILRRNNISGYKIVFLPSKQQKKPRQYHRWSADEQQAYLQELFFKNLNKFSRSNISSALIYWLLSTSSISEDAIEIGHFNAPDFSFLESLSHRKVLALHTLLLHDGLTEAQFIEVLNILHIQGKRLLKILTDDGVVLEREGIFTINPLLFKPTVDMLRAKNFIY